MELNFHSTKELSKSPVHGHYPRVRKTEVVLKDNKGREVKAETICNPNDTDNKILGQKYAVRKLADKFDNKEFRTKIWKLFKNSSKKRKKIMS